MNLNILIRKLIKLIKIIKIRECINEKIFFKFIKRLII